ncbi:MAG: hypothetical protein WCA44_17875 [Acidobacteriaceae bacterium]
MEIRCTVDVSAAVGGLNDLQKKDIPFALAKSLTRSAQAGQRAVQDSLGGKFTLRNTFTRQGIRFKPAEKKAARIEADVHTDTANRATGAPDYLGLQQTGGEKVAHEGHTYIAVPTSVFRTLFGNGVRSRELLPGNLLHAVAGRYSILRRRKGMKDAQIALINQKLVRGWVIFVQKLADGHKAIMARSPYEGERDIYPLYLLIPEAHVRARLGMDKTVDAAVQAAFPEAWQETWRDIMVKGLQING